MYFSMYLMIFLFWCISISHGLVILYNFNCNHSHQHSCHCSNGGSSIGKKLKLCCHLVEGPSLLTGFACGCPDSLAEPKNYMVVCQSVWIKDGMVTVLHQNQFPDSSARILYSKETGPVTVMYQDQSALNIQ